MAQSGAKVAVVGATGIVGGQIAELIGERDFPWAELRLFAADSSTQSVESGDRMLPVSRLDEPSDLAPFDIAILAIDGAKASEIIAARPGPILIDLSTATIAGGTPIVAPGLTARERVVEISNAKLIGVPHPAAQVIAAILTALDGSGGFAGAGVMLSASAGGHQAVSKLFEQSVDLLNARLDLADDEPQLAFNVLAAPGSHELAAVIAAQVSALGANASSLAVNVVSVQTFHGSAVALFLPASTNSGEWAQRLRAAPGIILVEGDDASGMVDAVGQEAVIVRMSLSQAGAAIWCVFDGARLAALTAVWIAETLASHD
ncbi:MAG TPA: hypothetical protein VJN94_06360 [Candidatus Binataceae bacterium]|nr:hypothetical protein [Candidatus Binataceae bacterium]